MFYTRWVVLDIFRRRFYNETDFVVMTVRGPIGFCPRFSPDLIRRLGTLVVFD